MRYILTLLYYDDAEDLGIYSNKEQALAVREELVKLFYPHYTYPPLHVFEVPIEPSVEDAAARLDELGEKRARTA